MKRLPLERARRIAIGAQGLAASLPTGRVDLRHLRRVFRHIGALQIDSVNAIERAHHLTLFSRLGIHDRDLLWRALAQREIFEYWGHVASFLPVEVWPLLRHRMEAFEPWRQIRLLQEERPGYIEDLLAEVRERGPLAPADLSDPGDREQPYWSTTWTHGKLVLEWLFATGRVTTALRRNFTRHYDVVERVIPAEHLNAPAPDREEAQRRLLMAAARSLGVATAPDLADYYRISPREARPLIEELAAGGEMERIEVAGWKDPAFLHPEATTPRKVERAVLLCPFDSLIWHRDRLERLFDIHYRVEIYVPEKDRRWGYYVFPLLLGDRIVARVDLKADRPGGRLLVPAAYLEEGVAAREVLPALIEQLQEMAAWLELDTIAVGDRGDLAAALRSALPGGARSEE
jgi:uncharacterized protein YcaQ